MKHLKRKTLKKIISFISAIAVAVTTLASASGGALAIESSNIKGNTILLKEVKNGDIIDISFDVSLPKGISISSAQLRLSYDNDVIEQKDITEDIKKTNDIVTQISSDVLSGVKSNVVYYMIDSGDINAFISKTDNTTISSKFVVVDADKLKTAKSTNVILSFNKNDVHFVNEAGEKLDKDTINVNFTDAVIKIENNNETSTTTPNKSNSNKRESSTTYYTVKFDPTISSVITKTVESGSVIKEIPAPTKTGYKFAGWYLDDKLYDFTTPIVKDITLTAKYIKDEEIIDKNQSIHKAYMSGYPDNTFKPENKMTRAEVCAMLYNLLPNNQKNEYQVKESLFSDVKADDWYNVAVNILASAGIIKGYDGNQFMPNKTITRAEFATIICKYNNLTISSYFAKFNDIKKNFWANGYILSVAEENWISGYPNGNFEPNQNITRAEVVSVINRMLARSTNEESFKNHEYNVFKDCDVTAWYYPQIIEATNNHSFYIRENAEIWN